MTEFWLKLLGVEMDEAVRIADVSLAFRGGFNLGWILLFTLLLGTGIYLAYRFGPASLPTGRRLLLTGLRILFVGLILMLFLRPVLSLTVEGSVRRMLVLLMDGSSSMQIEDPRVEQDDLKRAAIAKGELDPTGGLKQNLSAAKTAQFKTLPRLEIAQSSLQNKDLNLLPRLDKEFDLSAFTFGQGIAELSTRTTITPTNQTAQASTAAEPGFDWVNDLKADNSMTALGDALRDVMNRKRGQPLAGIVLVSDGAHNSGSHPREIASLMRQENLPVYVYGVGIASPRDIIVASLFAPDVSFVREEMVVNVRVRSQGLEGESAEVVLSMGDDVVARNSITLQAEGEQVVPMQFAPQVEGEYELIASVAPRPDEAVSDNNEQSHRLKVVDSKIKVLMVDHSPRWEFRYLQAMLMRDRRVDLHCLLLEADPRIARTADSPHIEKFPSRKEELFQYDLVIFGDVNPQAISATQLENLSELVSRFGGALVVVAGKRFTPHMYRRGIMEKLLPVEYDVRSAPSTKDEPSEKPIHLELTAAGKASPMLRLSDSPAENIELWKQLPPIYWTAKATRPKPAAEVLLVDPDPAKETRFGKMPVFAVQQYGLGQVMYVGSDNTWRWRKNVGDIYYTTLWGQIAQRVSLQRLLGVSKRTQLTSDRQNFLTGDRVTIFARLYSTGYEPMKEPVITGIFGLKNGLGPRTETPLRPLPEQPGLYRGEFIAPNAGAYQFFVEHDFESPLDFIFSEPQFELGETAMNETLLREIAATSGGGFFREEDLHVLPETISSKTERVQSPMEVELWASPFYFLLLLAVVTVEWVLRKMSYLK
jgi:hypothetical protein